MRLIPIALTPRELSDLNSVLDLAASRLTTAWTIGYAAEKNGYYIISLNREEELSALLPTLPDPNPSRIIAYIPETEAMAARWKIIKRAGSPPRLSEIIELLNAIAAVREEPPLAAAPEEAVLNPEPAAEEVVDEDVEPSTEVEVAPSEPPMVEPPEEEAPAAFEDEYQAIEEEDLRTEAQGATAVDERARCLVAMEFSKMQELDWPKTGIPLVSYSAIKSFPELLQQTLKDQCARLFSLHGEHFILASPRDGLFHFSANLPNTLLLFRTFPDRIKAKTLPIKRIPTYAQRFTPHSAPIAELLWMAALHDSQASPLPDTSSAASQRLLAVDVLAELPYFGEFSSLANIWHSNYLTLEMAANRSGEPMGKTVAFYNAIHLLQLFEAKPQQDRDTGPMETAKESSVPTLWQKIRGMVGSRRESG